MSRDGDYTTSEHFSDVSRMDDVCRYSEAPCTTPAGGFSSACPLTRDILLSCELFLVPRVSAWDGKIHSNLHERKFSLAAAIDIPTARYACVAAAVVVLPAARVMNFSSAPIVFHCTTLNFCIRIQYTAHILNFTLYRPLYIRESARRTSGSRARRN